jgi:transposase
LKSLTTHKTDRNDARGLAHLARTGFFKPVHVKSLPAHAVRSLIIARKKLVGHSTLSRQTSGGRRLNFPARRSQRGAAISDSVQRLHELDGGSCRPELFR